MIACRVIKDILTIRFRAMRKQYQFDSSSHGSFYLSHYLLDFIDCLMLSCSFHPFDSVQIDFVDINDCFQT